MTKFSNQKVIIFIYLSFIQPFYAFIRPFYAFIRPFYAPFCRIGRFRFRRIKRQELGIVRFSVQYRNYLCAQNENGHLMQLTERRENKGKRRLMYIERNFNDLQPESITKYTFGLIMIEFIAIFAGEYNISDYGAERFNEREA